MLGLHGTSKYLTNVGRSPSIAMGGLLINDPNAAKEDESRKLMLARKAKEVEVADVRAVVKKRLKDQMNATIDAMRADYKAKK